VDTSEKRDTAQRRCVIAQRKRYTKQFKEEALQLVSQEGVSLNQVAQDLGLDASMLRRWRKEANVAGPNAFRGQGLARDEELAKLKCELGRVKRERDFLKDAAAYFAKESKRGFGV
jgi:transposase